MPADWKLRIDLPDLALLWCNNVKSTALPANVGFWVDCFMTQGYLTGKRLRTPVLAYTLSAMNKHSAMNKNTMLKITKQQEQNTEWKRTAYSAYNNYKKSKNSAWKLKDGEQWKSRRKYKTEHQVKEVKVSTILHSINHCQKWNFSKTAVTFLVYDSTVCLLAGHLQPILNKIVYIKQH